ncbi:MAG: hypothetical protein FWD73_16930, partial [Polyangiaceae bacterium]|nr:hypothetical protein [Polyangiaceae bacterium]
KEFDSLAQDHHAQVMGEIGLVTSVVSGALGPPGAVAQLGIDFVVDSVGTKEDKYAYGAGQMVGAVVTGAAGLVGVGAGIAAEGGSSGAASEVAVPLAAAGAQTVVVAGSLAVGAGILMSRGAAPVKPASPDTPATEPEKPVATEPSKSAEAEAPVKASSPAAGPSKADVVKPSKSPDANAVPRGRRATFNRKDEPETIRSVGRENEAADVLARNGYEVEQKPTVPGDKKPDYRVEGEIFDCYAPKKGTKARGIGTAIEKKVKDKQTERVVLNMNDWDGNVESMRKQLTDYPINGLKEVKVVKGKSVINLFP